MSGLLLSNFSVCRQCWYRRIKPCSFFCMFPIFPMCFNVSLKLWIKSYCPGSCGFSLITTLNVVMEMRFWPSVRLYLRMVDPLFLSISNKHTSPPVLTYFILCLLLWGNWCHGGMKGPQLFLWRMLEGSFETKSKQQWQKTMTSTPELHNKASFGSFTGTRSMGVGMCFCLGESSVLLHSISLSYLLILFGA